MKKLENFIPTPSPLAAGSFEPIWPRRRGGPERRNPIASQALAGQLRSGRQQNVRDQHHRILDHRKACSQGHAGVTGTGSRRESRLCLERGFPLRPARNEVGLAVRSDPDSLADMCRSGYCASKWGVRGLSLTAAQEFAEYGTNRRASKTALDEF